jgi:hypothetical protein
MLNQIRATFGCAQYDIAAEAVAKRKVNGSVRCVRFEDRYEVGHMLFDGVLPADVA